MSKTACPTCGLYEAHAHWCKENVWVTPKLRPLADVAHTMTANDTQVGGTHYKSKAIQPWDYIASNSIGYLEGNVIKYVSRWKDKGGVADLEKARHYLDKLIELQRK